MWDAHPPVVGILVGAMMVTHKRPKLSFELESSGELGSGEGFMEKVTSEQDLKGGQMWPERKEDISIERTHGTNRGQ